MFSGPRKGLLAAAMLLVAAAPATAQEVKLRFNQWLPAAHWANTSLLRVWADEVQKVTANRVTIEFTSASLGAPNRQYQLAVDGVADLAWGPHAWMPGQFPLTGIMDLPFLGDSVEGLSVAYWKVHSAHFAKADEHRDVKLLAVHTQAPNQLLTSKKEVATVDDLKGLKIRAAGPQSATLLKGLGAVPIAAPTPQLQEMVSRGVLDGTFLSNEGVSGFHLLDLLKFELALPGGWQNSSFFLVMNKAKWNAIGPADQKAIEGVSGEAFARLAGKVWDGAVSKGLADMAKAGIKIRTADAAFVQAVRSQSEPLVTEWLAAAKAKGVDGDAALKMLRAEAAKVAAPK